MQLHTCAFLGTAPTYACTDTFAFVCYHHVHLLLDTLIHKRLQVYMCTNVYKRKHPYIKYRLHIKQTCVPWHTHAHTNCMYDKLTCCTLVPMVPFFKALDFFDIFCIIKHSRFILGRFHVGGKHHRTWTQSHVGSSLLLWFAHAPVN